MSGAAARTGILRKVRQKKPQEMGIIGGGYNNGKHNARYKDREALMIMACRIGVYRERRIFI